VGSRHADYAHHSKKHSCRLATPLLPQRGTRTYASYPWTEEQGNHKAVRLWLGPEIEQISSIHGESTSSTNERPHIQFSMYPASAVDKRSCSSVAQRWRISCIFLESWILLARSKREMRENLLCMKRWYRRTRSGEGPCEAERGQRKEVQVSHSAVTSCQISGNYSHCAGT
jgi:hypothetical protein